LWLFWIRSTSDYIRWMLIIARCSVVGLWLALVSGWLVIMHRYLYCFPLSLFRTLFCAVKSQSFSQTICRVICRISYCHLPFQSKWLYVGTERGNVHVVSLESFTLSGYIINWNKAIELWVSNVFFFVTQLSSLFSVFASIVFACPFQFLVWHLL